MAFGAALLYSSSQKYIAAIYYGQGLKNLAENNLAKAMVKLDKASAFDGQSDQYLRTMSQALLLQANDLAKQASAASNPQNNQLQIQQSVALAVQKARLAVSLNPSDSFNWSNLANVYENIISAVQGADTFAIENYKKAMTLDPKNPQEVVNLARVYLSMADRMQGTESQKEEWQKKLNEAQKILEQALTLKADYAPAHFQVAMIYVREGKTKEAIERLEAAKTAAPLDAGLAFQLGLLYYNTDQVDQAQAEFERAVAVDQNYSNARYFLGLTYDQKGLKLKAMEQFSKIAALNPTNQEVPKIINNLREGKPVLEGLVPPSEPPLERTEAPVEEETPTEP
jgi:tetratricopeptide (TPR) repeat protein